MNSASDNVSAAASAGRPMLLDIVHIIRKRWRWAVAAGLLTLPLGLLPLLQPPRYSATFTVSGPGDQDISELYAPGSLTTREPLVQQVDQGRIEIRTVSRGPAEQTFAVSADDAAAVQLALAEMVSVAEELKAAEIDRVEKANASAREYLVMQITSYEELRKLMLETFERATDTARPADLGDLPSTVLDLTKLLLPLQNELAGDAMEVKFDGSQIAITRSNVTLEARPARLLAIGMLGVALAVGLLAAIVSEAVFRVRSALSTP